MLVDAHNCYPEGDDWRDRIDRALATGLPVAIEQDLVWRPADAGRPAHSIVSHGEPFTGREPSLRSTSSSASARSSSKPCVTTTVATGHSSR